MLEFHKVQYSDLCFFIYTNNLTENFQSNPNSILIYLNKHQNLFTHEVKKVLHPLILFNDKPVQQASSQKHLGLVLDTSLMFDEHINTIISKVSKTIGLLWKLNNRLPRSSHTTSYKSIMKPHLDYDDVMFDEAYNNSFQQRLESFQYKALLAITGVLKVLLPRSFVKR